MIELHGKYNKAKVFTDNIESTAQRQIIELCSQEFSLGSNIRIMPDTHAGAGCTIGTTMTVSDKVVPNLVGVDIGCGMLVVKLLQKEIDFSQLDEVIRKYIPSGFSVREKEHSLAKSINIDKLRCIKHIKLDRVPLSVGTLGGGNHFIEINRDSSNSLYLVIHSGSRNLGKQVAEYYQDVAFKSLLSKHKDTSGIIKKLKSDGKHSEIESTIKKLAIGKTDKALAYLEGTNFNDYIHDMKIVQNFATLNRKAMADEVLRNMSLSEVSSFTTIHNYIDTDNMILRKGAISAKLDEVVLIPINMRDGSLLCKGRGMQDWNYSAPHGAGRIMSRSQAKKLVSLNEYKESMTDVWTTSVNEHTLDESPMVYKPIEEILENIKESVDMLDILKPLYNFKAN